ncbi:uncharacterized protein LOC115286834 [Suricata suricatta]|uniref:uncharacterized protein LOC115286834 n=1 Tax=Suricata suricatta TaxID=37032 RepID=UPI0011556FE0|nr:uncharacterized protein LOC115286834 [Suricata suricatta]
MQVVVTATESLHAGLYGRAGPFRSLSVRRWLRTAGVEVSQRQRLPEASRRRLIASGAVVVPQVHLRAHRGPRTRGHVDMAGQTALWPFLPPSPGGALPMEWASQVALSACWPSARSHVRVCADFHLGLKRTGVVSPHWKTFPLRDCRSFSKSSLLTGGEMVGALDRTSLSQHHGPRKKPCFTFLAAPVISSKWPHVSVVSVTASFTQHYVFKTPLLLQEPVSAQFPCTAQKTSLLGTGPIVFISSVKVTGGFPRCSRYAVTGVR